MSAANHETTDAQAGMLGTAAGEQPLQSGRPVAKHLTVQITPSDRCARWCP